MKTKILFVLMSIFTNIGHAQSLLNSLDFFYAGQSKNRQMFIVKNGKIKWYYNDPQGKGEISDAVLMTDNHILMAQQYSIREIDSKQNVIWQLNTPANTEIHTIQPIGKNNILYVQNGKPAKVIVRSIPDLKLVHEFELPYNEGGSVHGQFRNARLTSKGTLLVANMSMGFVSEYDFDGKELHHWNIPGPWSATELKNGNILIVARKGNVREINRDGNVVMEVNTSEYDATQIQKAYRLNNGHTVVSNWFNEWDNKAINFANPPIQALEIDKEGKLVSTLKSWSSPYLGPATTIQPLSQKVNRKKMYFGKIK